jgi:asparagine synthase (glutamine-hydrolysing)
MCGILGMVGNYSHDFVLNNLDSLSRRGPDSKGFLDVKNGFTVGATRLAMTDPSERSNQPMQDYSNGNIIVFNGEIYNYKSIRKKLIKMGTIFYTESDTEVVLKLLHIYGNDGVSLLEGMFAFAFYSRQSNSIILARDFLGKKPLYYSQSLETFTFSSSLGVVKRALKSVNLDEISLFSYLKIGYIIDPRTIFKNIFAIMPGEVAVFDLNKFLIVNRKIFLPESLAIRTELSIEDSLNQAILQRTDENPRFAISLSGGLDSSIIALQSKKLNLEPKAYTLGFANSDKKRYSFDAEGAKEVANFLKIGLKVVEMPAPDLIPQLLDQYVDAMEEPNSNPTGLSMMWLYSQIKEDGHRLVLTGDGADEVFGGYARYNKLNSFRYFPENNNLVPFSLFERNNLFYKVLVCIFEKYSSDRVWLIWHALLCDSEIENLLGYSKKLPIHSEIFSRINSLYGSRNKTSAVMIRDLAIWLSAESNRRLDRVSMYNSIEARSPFQSELVISAGYREMQNSNFRILNKKILFNNIKGVEYIPTLKNKSGFTSPLGFWLRSNPILINETLDFMKLHLPINNSTIKILKDSAKNGVSKDFKTLWSIIILSRWLKKNI